jgi:hypothetical protein
MKGAVSVHFTPKCPDLSPSDFHTFGPMKETLRGRKFSSDKEVIGAVKKLVKDATKIFFPTEFKRKTCEKAELVNISGGGLH